MKILTRVPHPGDGVSIYRGFGPLSHLRKIMDVEFQQLHTFDWTHMASCDGVYMVRPATDQDVALMRLAQKCGRKVWIDYDDNVLEIPPHNPSYDFYAQEKIQNNIRVLRRYADIVSVSTKLLFDEFSRFRKGPVYIIPNAFPDHILNWNQENVERRNIVSWRGSRTHDKDLSLAHEFFTRFQQDRPDWKFYFFGQIDHRTMDLFPKESIRVYPFSDVIDYFHLFKQCGSKIHVVPLEDSPFNRSKSNIAWIEASWAGSPVYASQLPEWTIPGTIGDLDKIFEPGHVGPDVESSRSIIESSLLLSKVNLTRRMILEEHF